MIEPSLLVLSSLAEGDKHGYAMMVDIEAFSGIRLGAGTLYGAITRLEERGFIRALDSEDRRQPYRVTAAGRKYLAGQLSLLDRAAKVGLDRLRRHETALTLAGPNLSGRVARTVWGRVPCGN